MILSALLKENATLKSIYRFRKVQESQIVPGSEMSVRNFEVINLFSKYYHPKRVPRAHQYENEAKRKIVNHEETTECKSSARVCKAIQKLELYIMWVTIIS